MKRLSATGKIAGRKRVDPYTKVIAFIPKENGYMVGRIDDQNNFFWTLSTVFSAWQECLNDKYAGEVRFIQDTDGLFYSIGEMEGVYGYAE